MQKDRTEDMNTPNIPSIKFTCYCLLIGNICLTQPRTTAVNKLRTSEIFFLFP